MCVCVCVRGREKEESERERERDPIPCVRSQALEFQEEEGPTLGPNWAILVSLMERNVASFSRSLHLLPFSGRIEMRSGVAWTRHNRVQMGHQWAEF